MNLCDIRIGDQLIFDIDEADTMGLEISSEFREHADSFNTLLVEVVSLEDDDYDGDWDVEVRIGTDGYGAIEEWVNHECLSPPINEYFSDFQTSEELNSFFEEMGC